MGGRRVEGFGFLLKGEGGLKKGGFKGIEIVGCLECSN